MTKPKNDTGYVQNDAYTQEDWDGVSDNPELTDDQLSQLRPAQEVLPPDMYKALVNRGGRPRSDARKVSVTIRLDPQTVETFKAAGPGWQTRMNETLVNAAKRLKRKQA